MKFKILSLIINIVIIFSLLVDSIFFHKEAQFYQFAFIVILSFFNIYLSKIRTSSAHSINYSLFNFDFLLISFIYFVFFLICIIVNLYNSASAFQYITVLGYLLSYTLSIIFFANLYRLNKLDYFFDRFIIFATIASCICIFAIFFDINFITYKPIYNFFFLKPNASIFKDLLIAGFIFALSSLFIILKVIHNLYSSKLYSYLLLSLNLLALLITNSRGAIIALILTLFYLFVKRLNLKSTYPIYIIIIAFLIFCALNFEIINQYFRVNQGLSNREIRWDLAFSLLNDNLFGYGTNSNVALIENYLDFPKSSGFHNIFLNIAVQYGVIALFFYLLIYAIFSKSLFSKNTVSEFHSSIFLIIFFQNFVLSYNIGGLRFPSFLFGFLTSYYLFKRKL